MLAITKFMTDRLIAGKPTTAKDIASKFRTQNAKVMLMIKEAQVSGEMLLAINTDHLMAKTELKIVSLGLDVAQDLGITDNYGKPAGFNLMNVDEEIQIMAKKTAKVADVEVNANGAMDPTAVELDESGAQIGASEVADGEGADGTEQWYEGAVDESELPPVVKTGKKTRSPEEIQAELDAKAAKKAERDAEKAAKAAERETAKAEVKAQREAQREAQRAERERKAAERRAQSTEDSTMQVFATEEEALAAHPEGIVKFSEFYKMVSNAGINPRRLMKATGGDHCRGEVLGEIWMPFIIGTTRKYLSKLVEVNMDQLTPKEEEAGEPEAAE